MPHQQDNSLQQGLNQVPAQLRAQADIQEDTLRTALEQPEVPEPPKTLEPQSGTVRVGEQGTSLPMESIVKATQENRQTTRELSNRAQTKAAGIINQEL